MNYQKVFDLTTEHLRLQGKVAMNTTTGFPQCRYRTDEGDACAIGCHIPTADYSDNLENRGVTGLYRDFPPLLEKIFNDGDPLTGYMLTFLSELQSAHDIGLKHSMAVWEVEMMSVARKHHLQYTPPQYDEALSLAMAQEVVRAAKMKEIYAAN